MSTTEPAGAATPSLFRDLLGAARFHLRGRRGLIVLAVLVVGAGAASSWAWLVAAGVAPLLLSILPCAAMCALGLCMNRATGSAHSTEGTTEGGTLVVDPDQLSLDFTGAGSAAGPAKSPSNSAATTPNQPTKEQNSCCATR